MLTEHQTAPIGQETPKKVKFFKRNPWCSFQDNLNASHFRRGRRIHGLQLPLHPLQLIGWVALTTFGLATFLVLIPALKTSAQQPLFGLLSGLYVVHGISHLAALLLDPSDPELRKQNVDRIVPEFDRTKHAHVIENGRCHLCNIATSSFRTKHCSVCNKCVGKFDHHCKWLNHCVGERNYVAFLMCVVSAVCATLVIWTAAIAEIWLYHIKPEWLNIWSWGEESSIFFNDTTSSGNGSLLNDTAAGLNVSHSNVSESLGDTVDAISSGIGLHDTVFLAFLAVLGILAAISAGLLLHLCFFHIYISFLGLTTYEYIRNRRQNGNSNTPSTLPAVIEADSTLAASSVYFCSSVATSSTSTEAAQIPQVLNRPRSLHCCESTREYEHQVAHHHRAYYVCSLLKQSSSAAMYGNSSQECESRTFHCCSQLKRVDQEALPQTNNQSIVRYAEQCTFCSFRIKAPAKTDALSFQSKRCCLKSITKHHHRWRRKWNCCSSVPDSPDIPVDAIRTVTSTVPPLPHGDEPKMIDAHLRHNEYHDKKASLHRPPRVELNGSANNIGGKHTRSRLVRPWPVSRFRHMLRTIGQYRTSHCRRGNNAVLKQNQIRPLSSVEQHNTTMPIPSIHVQTVLPTSAIRSNDDDSATDMTGISLPALPPPPRRKIRNTADLQELADTLAFVQHPRNGSGNPIRRQGRRKNLLRTRSPTLSPIHESGLSNPTSPKPCRHATCNSDFCSSDSITNINGSGVHEK
ncbi:uncharacterized protein LOC132263055 isoform X1 [Phlebotomus argentipes]|uniref:uncharacterized protein LOC132263055 isoform X1 n=1 Tax=Phlebotomus argentipes TaxID=94469 RepID=UPI0028929867|nr:uncharacterized protein LOC132263055 isoform X1 [Phlebotomus argentipes]